MRPAEQANRFAVCPGGQIKHLDCLLIFSCHVQTLVRQVDGHMVELTLYAVERNYLL
jgi:hypothetical protein